MSHHSWFYKTGYDVQSNNGEHLDSEDLAQQPGLSKRKMFPEGPAKHLVGTGEVLYQDGGFVREYLYF